MQIPEPADGFDFIVDSDVRLELIEAIGELAHARIEGFERAEYLIGRACGDPIRPICWRVGLFSLYPLLAELFQ